MDAGLVNNLKVIYEDNHIIVVEKPCNLLMQEDKTKDPDLLTMTKEYLKRKYQKPGNVYLGLVHRLDRPVGGVVVFAKTSKAASRLSNQIRLHQFQKQYIAIVEDNNLKNEGTFQDYLSKNEQTNTSFVDAKGKLSILSYKVLSRKDNLAKVLINLKTGRHHQIRVQFSNRNHALWADQRYNPKAIKHQQLALWAYRLTLIHPTLKQAMTFESPIPNQYPFTI